MSKINTSIWSGVYDFFNEVPLTDKVFDSDLWAKKQKNRINALLASFENFDTIPDSALSKDYPFATVVATLLLSKPSLRIVDYGGAMGQSYLDLLAKIPNSEARLDYTIVETNAVIDNVPSKMKAFKQLAFVDDIKKIEGEIDIIHLGSTLQYVDDWKGFFVGLIEKFQSKLFVLSDLLVGDIPSFVTAQNYYGETIPVRFINIADFKNFWQGNGYKLAYQSYFQPLDGGEYFPIHELPKTHRIKKASHLIFQLI